MFRTHLPAILVALLCAAALGLTPTRADAQLGEKAAQARDTVRLLAEPISMKDFQVPMKLKEALNLIYEKMAPQGKGKEVPILVNTDAFKAADANAPDVYDVDVKFPAFPPTMSLASALRILLGQIPGQKATFLVKPGYIEITTVREADVRRQLKQKTLATFDNQPLEQVLHELGAESAVSVIIDPRASDKVKKLVSATFVNDIPLLDALELLTDTAGLKVVVRGGGVYVTTPENAAVLRREQAARAAESRKAASERKGETAPAKPGK